MQKVADPLRRLPPRTADSVRRTESLRIVPVPTWDAALRLDGVARDSRVDSDGSITSAEPVTMQVDVDARSHVASLAATGLDDSAVDALVGRHAITGFRGAVSKLGAVDLTTPSAALLDDLPVVRLISGYALLMKKPRRIEDPPSAPILNICRGWAEGDTAYQLAMSGRPVVNTTTSSPVIADMLADPDDFHDEPPARPDSMCRRRILEISVLGDGFGVFEYFRDSYVDDDAAESSLHEYVVRARVGADWTIEEVDVEPRALPFPECPLVAPNARALQGSSVRDVHRSVRNLLSGTEGCTHLSDTLRFLRFTEPLAGLLHDRSAP